MRLFLFAYLFLSSLFVQGQIKVKEEVVSNQYTIYIYCEGHLAIKEEWIRVGNELIRHGKWVQYDKQGYSIYRANYHNGFLLTESRLIKNQWTTKHRPQ